MNILEENMYCRKCGRKLNDDDNFCPNCGIAVDRVESTAEEVIDNGVVNFDPDNAPSEKESLNLKWDVDDFKREPKREDIKIDWDDLIADEEKSSDKISDIIDEAASPVVAGACPVEETVFEAVKEKSNDKFDTFTAKNKEFQELLEKEQNRVKAAREQRGKRLEDLGLSNLNKPIEIEDEDENKPSAAERIKKRREERAKKEATVMMDPVLPLKMDDDDVSGSWPPEINEVEEDKETIEEMVEKDSEKTSEKTMKAQTQQISREEFAEFLKKAEEEFGFDDIDESIVEEEKEIPNEEPEPIEEIQEEIPEVIEEVPEEEKIEEEAPLSRREEKRRKKEEKKRMKEKDLEFGGFDDDSFWNDDDEYVEKKGGALTAVIVILAIILVIQIAVLVIRFQFPDSQAAQFIEPFMTRIENWIRGIFG